MCATMCFGTVPNKATYNFFGQHRALTTLNISYNKLGPQFAKAMAEMLKFNTALTKLECVWKPTEPALRCTRARLFLPDVLPDTRSSFPARHPLTQRQNAHTRSLRINALTDTAKRALADAKQRRAAPLELIL